MNNIIKQLKKSAKNTCLSSVEKAEMKSALLQHVKTHPVDQAVLASRSIPSPFYTSKFRNKKTISALLIGSLLVGSSVSFAAEGALPGDILYPVKVGVNENVRRAVAVTPQAKADLSVQLVERRLVEFEKLAVNPNVSPVTQQAAADNLKKYTHDAEESLETTENDNDGDEAITTATNLSAVLNTHEHILNEMHSDFVKNAVVTTSSVEAPTSFVVATTTPVVHRDHVASAQSVETTLQDIRQSIKDVETKNNELKKKYNKTEEAQATSTVNVSIKNTEHSQTHSAVISPAPVVVHEAVPTGIHHNEHSAVIESHHEAVVATSTTSMVPTTNTENQKIIEKHVEATKTSTSTESRHREDSHTETNNRD